MAPFLVSSLPQNFALCLPSIDRTHRFELALSETLSQGFVYSLEACADREQYLTMKRFTRGFSLLELMMITALAGMMCLVGSTALQRIQGRWALWQTAQSLTQFLIQLRSEANGRNCHAILHLSHGAQGAYLITDTSINKTCFSLSPRQFDLRVKGIEVEHMTEGIGFYGEMNAARNGTIVIKNDTGRYKIVISVWGRIRSYSQSSDEH